ncbi:MAG: TIGR03767 family metallophosphoesterase [Candidatus Dormibacteria bacterium]
MKISRRRFLYLGGAATGSLALPVPWSALAAGAQTVADLTTLGQTIVKGRQVGAGTAGAYYALRSGAGEPHIVRTELATPRPAPVRRSLASFAHFTDVHLVDAQSPARVEFVDRYNDPPNGCQNLVFNAAYRPQETLTLHVFEAMIRQVRAISRSPITGAPLQFSVCTGDNIDNQQYNELRWFIDLMDGAKSVAANSGGALYEGVQSSAWADVEYWHPDPAVTDKYKQQYGFPAYPGILDAALRSFVTTGIGMPWYQTYGNHDGLVQGNFPRDTYWSNISTGTIKITGAPAGLNPCDSFATLAANPGAFATAPARTVTADGNRRILSRAEYADEMFRTTGTPVGHGLTSGNRAAGTTYWVKDDNPAVRFIGLDTVNPGGESSGSIGKIQLDWLEARLVEVSSHYTDASGKAITTANTDRLVVLFSHHGLRSLDSQFLNPDPADPTGGDLPRQLAAAVEAVVHRFPNVVAWVNGHTHQNIVQPRPAPSGGGGFWDINTAAHIDWTCQSRLVEVVDNSNGTLSIFCTMVDHAAPIAPGGSDEVLRLASISRELTANDYQKGFGSDGAGVATDRNVELLLKAPFNLAAGPGGAGVGEGLPPTNRTNPVPLAIAGGAAVAAGALAARQLAAQDRSKD